MKQLLLKEFKLAMHPTALLFLFLSVMLLIPNYPYYVIFFYTGLSIFFTCLNGRENHDIIYTLSLPICKKDIVKSRFLFAILLELTQIILTIPFAVLRQSFPLPENLVGMDANIAFFGFSFLILGLFNFVFFSLYYKKPDRVGISFVISSIVMFFIILFLETLTHLIPLFHDQLDTRDPKFLVAKLVVLFAGILLYGILTEISYQTAKRSFEQLDL